MSKRRRMVVTEMNDNISGQKCIFKTISNNVKQNYRKWRKERKKKRNTFTLLKVELQDNKLREYFVPLAVEFFSYEDRKLLTFGSIPNDIPRKNIASKRDELINIELFQENYKSHCLRTLKKNSIICETSKLFDDRFSRVEMKEYKSKSSQLLRGTSDIDKCCNLLKGNFNGRAYERIQEGNMNSKFSESCLRSEREQPLQTLGIPFRNGEPFKTSGENISARVSKVCFSTQVEVTHSKLSQQCSNQERKLSFSGESFKPTGTEFRRRIDRLKNKCLSLLSEFSKTNQNLYLVRIEVNENVHKIVMNVFLRHCYFNFDTNHALWMQYLSFSTIAIVESNESSTEIKESDITPLLRKHIKNDISTKPALLSLCLPNSEKGCILGTESNTHNEYVEDIDAFVPAVLSSFYDDVLTYRKFLNRLNKTYNLVGMKLLSLQCPVPDDQLLSENGDIKGSSSFPKNLNSMDESKEMDFLYTWNGDNNEFSVNYLNSMDGINEGCGDYPPEYPQYEEELESNLCDEKMSHDYGCHSDFTFRSCEEENGFEDEIRNYQRHLERIERKYNLVKKEISSWILDEKFDDEIQPPIHVSDETDRFNTIYMFLNNHTRYSSSQEHWMRFKALGIDYTRHRYCRGCISSESDSRESSSPVAEQSGQSELNDSESSLDGSFKRFRRESRDSTSSSDSEETALWFQDNLLDLTESNNFPIAPERVNSSGFEEKNVAKGTTILE